MIRLDASLPTPPFEQIKQQIIAQRASGELPAGHRLLPVRTLAAALGVAANTVAKAYRELEHEGVIVTRGRQGSFVTGTAATADKAAAAAARVYAGVVRRLGVDDQRAVALVLAALAEHRD